MVFDTATESRKGSNQSTSPLKGAFVHLGVNMAFIFKPHIFLCSQTNHIFIDNYTNIESGGKVLLLKYYRARIQRDYVTLPKAKQNHFSVYEYTWEVAKAVY